ncbi:MAG: GNAT family N-acetyltransferase [Candidatus Dormibacteraeota bacterium]|nr:GNAT family N-acetyltransferase [Candidatus Dormibacteraeota bacterium]
MQGARLMASGIPTPKWNNADVTAPNPDLDAVAHWYAELDLPWGLRVPVEFDIPMGDPLFVKRCWGLRPPGLERRATPAVQIRLATAADLDQYAETDAVVFGDDPALSRRWVEATLGRPGFEHWLAMAGGRSVGVAEVVRTNDWAGPAAMLTGVGALGEWKGDGVEQALAQFAVEHAFESGVALVHAHDQDEALCRAIGFEEVPGFLIRVVRTN